MRLESYLCGEWQQGEGPGVVTSVGIDVGAALHHARTEWCIEVTNQMDESVAVYDIMTLVARRAA